MISTLLKQLMLECKLKQPDLAKVLGASLDRVKGLTSGRIKNLTREESEALIDKLNIRADWLVTGSGPMFQIEDETQDEFIARQQAINRMGALIKAMPLREFTQTRLGMVMTGHAAQDGATIYDAISKEVSGMDFVTGKAIEGVAERSKPPPDEQLLLDTYRRCTPQARANLIQTAALLSAGMAAPDAATGANSPKRSGVKEKKAKTTVTIGGTHSQHASGDASIQIGSMGNTPTKRRG